MSAYSWPTVGSTWTDDTGRTLHVTEVHPKSRSERHVVGVISQRPYACSALVFDVVWRARRTGDEAQVAHDEPAAITLYDEHGKPRPYSRRSA